MTNEKLIIVIARVKKDDKSEKSVPLSLKVKDSDLQGINTDTNEHPRQNLVEISLDFAETIPVLIVAVADDSAELLNSYRRFCEFAKSTKMPPVESKTIHFVNIEGIQVKRIKATGLACISKSRLQNFLKRAEALKAIQKQKQQKKPESKKESPESSRKSKPKKSNSKIILDDESKKDSNYHLRAKPQTPKKFKPKTPVKNDSGVGASPNKRERILIKLQALASYVNPMEESNSKKSFEEIIKILNIFNKILIPESHIKDDESIRMIPEKDETKDDGDLTLIEGILPVYTNKYKKAINHKSIKESDVEPTILLANIVRYAFPKHWISNVTIRGSGGRKSLISLWNYKNPLKTTVEGSSIPGLGDKRFKALLDHVVRKCGKKSYDIGIEKNLISTFAKALHYSRNRLSGGSRKKEDESSSSSESDSDSSDYSDDSNNDEIRIVCTPDIDVIDSDDNEEEEEFDEESLMNSLFDAATVEGNSSEDDEQRKSKNRRNKTPVTTIERVTENCFKKPEAQQTSSQRVDKVSHHSESKNDSSVDSGKTKSPSQKQSNKAGSIKNIYYNAPGTPSKRSNESSPIPNAKKQKPSDGSQIAKNQALNEGILSQDESAIRAKLATQTNQDESSEKSGGLDAIFNDDDSVDSHEDGEITD